MVRTKVLSLALLLACSAVAAGTTVDDRCKSGHPGSILNDHRGPILFKCKDGSGCINLLNRCDGERQCLDGSDEELCDGCPGQFQCKNGGRCWPTLVRCDGEKVCADDSDETTELCDGFPKVALPANATVRLRVQFKEEYESLVLQLCHEEHCSVVLLRGLLTNGSLVYMTSSGCGLRGQKRCSGVMTDNYYATHEKYIDFTTGEIVLQVQHRLGWLAVWREGRPDDVVEVPVDQEGNYDTLRVRPMAFWSDMLVDFTDSTEEPVATGAAAAAAEPSTDEAAATTQKPSST